MPKTNGAGIATDPTLTGRGLLWLSVLRQLSRKALGLRCFPFPASDFAIFRWSGSVTGARTGIRFLLAAIPIRRSSCLLSGSAADHPMLVDHLKRKYFHLGFRSFFDVRPACPANSDMRSRSFQTGYLHSAEAFCTYSSKTARTVTAVSSGFKKTFVFKSLNHHSKVNSCPSDGLKLRLCSRPGKDLQADLSTFCEIRCGHAWINQRFTEIADPLLYRSRCASNRSRKAFSLMNPSASCWSYAPASSSNVTCCSE